MRWWLVLLLLVTPVAAQDSQRPIEIYGDSDFTPAAGVRSGAGTEDDPYIISDWRIDPRLVSLPGNNVAIHLENTDAHVIFRNIWITSPFDVGFEAFQSNNIRIESLTVGDAGRAVSLREVENLALADLNIARSGPDDVAAGIWLRDGRGIRIENAVLLEGQGPGLVATNSRSLRLEGIQVTGHDDGVRVQGVTDATLLGVNARDNRGDGIALANVTRMTLLGLEATGQLSTGGAFSGRGVVVLESSGSIRDVVASNNAAQGAKIWNSDVNLREGRFLDNGQAGLQMSVPSLWIQNVEAHGNGRNGIEIFPPDNLPRATLDAVQVHNNGGAGLLLQGLDGIHMARIRSEENAIGLDVRASQNVTLLNSHLLNNVGDGLRFSAVVGGQVVGSHGDQNGGNGFLLATSHNLLLRNNTARDNAGAGFYLDGQGLRVELNRAASNGKGASVVAPGAEVELQNNGFDGEPIREEAPNIWALIPLALALFVRRHQVA